MRTPIASVMQESDILCNCNVHQVLNNSDVHSDRSQNRSTAVFKKTLRFSIMNLSFSSCTSQSASSIPSSAHQNVSGQFCRITGLAEELQGPDEAAVSEKGIFPRILYNFKILPEHAASALASLKEECPANPRGWKGGRGPSRLVETPLSQVLDKTKCGFRTRLAFIDTHLLRFSVPPSF